MLGETIPRPQDYGFAHIRANNFPKMAVLYKTGAIDVLLTSPDRYQGSPHSTALHELVDQLLDHNGTGKLQKEISLDNIKWDLLMELTSIDDSKRNFDIYLSLTKKTTEALPAKDAPSFNPEKRATEALATEVVQDGTDRHNSTQEDYQVAFELTENIPVGTYTMVLRPQDEVGDFYFVSKRFLEITGLTKEEAQSDPFRAFECVHPSDLPVWIEKNRQAFERKEPFREETRLSIDGATRWVVAESIPRQLSDETWVWEGVIQDITDQKTAEAALAEATRELIEQKEIEGRLSERQSILRDMHDGIGAHLVLAAIRLKQGKISTQDAYQTLQGCIADLRIMIDTLDSSNHSLLDCLESFRCRVEDSLAGSSISVAWDVALRDQFCLPPSNLLNIMRMVNESVTNAIRHSNCQNLSITVNEDGDCLHVAIYDDGDGFDVSKAQKGRGLINMKQRAKQYGCDINIESGRSGTTVYISL